jgi:hypothetical protein
MTQLKAALSIPSGGRSTGAGAASRCRFVSLTPVLDASVWFRLRGSSGYSWKGPQGTEKEGVIQNCIRLREGKGEN